MQYTTRDIILSILSDDLEEAKEIAPGIKDPDEIIDASSHFTILHRLAQGAAKDIGSNDMEYVKLMAGINADFDKQDIKGRTPLMLLAGSIVDQEKLEFFINQTKNINARDKSGNSAIVYAAKNKSLENVQILMRGGANVELKNANNESVISIIKQYLTEAGATVILQEKMIRDAEAIIDKMQVEVHNDGSRTVTIEDQVINLDPIAVPARPKARRF